MRRTRALSFAIATVTLTVGAACSLFTDLEGLSDDGPNNTSPDSTSPEGSTDGGGALNPSSPDGQSPADVNPANVFLPNCSANGPSGGLVAYYNFDETDGDIVHDCTVSHFDGKLLQRAGETWTPNGIKGRGLKVSAPYGCVDLGAADALASLSTISVSVWTNMAALPTGGQTGYIIGRSLDADINGFRFGARQATVNEQKIGWLHTNGPEFFWEVPLPTNNMWHHLVFTVQPNNQFNLYVDGERKLNQTAAGGVIYPDKNVTLRIGCRGDNTSYWVGLIDELKIYNRVLSQAEVTELKGL